MDDYELLDSGEGEKLERFGKVVLSRPDPQALWRKHLDEKEWKKADATFTDSWNHKLDKWTMDYGGLKFWIKPTAFKHTGLFPEQRVNWDWMRGVIGDKKDIEVLNLFGYTGGATLACAQAHAKVVHVDGSKSAIAWARENAELSGLVDKPIRWIHEDARMFVGREIKRGNKYDAIIMDPPAFGHGADKQVWKIEENFLPLVEDCIKLLKDKPLFFIINGYSAGYSAIAYQNVLGVLVEKFGGEIEIGELTLPETGSDRLLPCGIFARWRKG
ncbi:MAG: class I SAM-dependent methyltransferase [Candidatus Taylorbacteria bacterium]|nr:class I SAM-dependent methyltransferase [Candidatus Taylorbacteria bacterium]